MGIIYGYARCSTNELRQDIGRQIREDIKFHVLQKRGPPHNFERPILLCLES